MAWTTPKTWSVGETLTAANFNTHIRDNLNATAPHLIARKTADQSVTSSTTLVDCTTLGLTVAANEIWQFSFNLVYVAGSVEGLKLAFTFPAAGNIAATSFWQDTSGTTGLLTFSGTTTPTSSRNFVGSASAFQLAMPVAGIFTNSTNAGTLQLQFAQQVSGGTSATIKANSTLWAAKLA